MSSLPALYARDVVGVLKRAGFIEDRQKGSHLIMVHEGKNRQITIPIHNKPLKRGTIGAIMRQGDIRIEEL